MKIKDKALNYHKNGCNCAQAVLAACSRYTKLDEKTALSVAAGFGGGMRSGEICGSISGAVMAIGLAFPMKNADDAETKAKVNKLSKKCVSAASCRYDCVRCRELKQKSVSCEEMIGFMAETAEAIIKDTRKQERRICRFMKNLLRAD